MATRLGLVRCEHCGRQFNPHSGARHIPWCAKQQSENKKHRLSQEKKVALERYKWRISYKPSNRFQHQPPIGQRQEQISACKRSPASINSSATLSSPSASSTNSITGGSSLNGYNIAPDRRASTVQQQQYQRARSRAPLPGASLKRSVSSLTLTKQRGVSEQLIGSQCTKGHSTRTKSTNDVSPGQQQMQQQQQTDLSEMVENLARQMKEIYAQNQMLLARISRSSKLKSSSQTPDPNDQVSDCDTEQQLSCHHCKSACFAPANYCHKCGCKLHTFSAAESPG